MTADDDLREAALERLPLPYATALRLRDARIPDDVIAQCVGVEPEALGPLLRVAEANTLRLYRDHGRHWIEAPPTP